MAEENEVKSSWADDFEEDEYCNGDDDVTTANDGLGLPQNSEETADDGLGLPQNSEEVQNDMNIMTKDGIDDKVVRRYKYEKKKVAKTIEERKAWTKFLVQASKEQDDGLGLPQKVAKAISQKTTWPNFGASKEDELSPNHATTIVSKDVSMQSITNKEDPDKDEDSLMNLKNKQDCIAACLICTKVHWATQCPYKDTLLPVQEALKAKDAVKDWK